MTESPYSTPAASPPRHVLTGLDHVRPPGSSGDAEETVRRYARDIVDLMCAIDRTARRAGRSLPTPAERREAADRFWRAVRVFATIEQRIRPEERAICAAAVHELLRPWLQRSSYWNRSITKPHGYAGDFRMLEWMYDLERDACADPTKPAVVNILDYLYSTVDSVRAVWHRRRWYARLINSLRANRDSRTPVRILDLACGGSRYLRDVILGEDAPGWMQPVFVDQDPAALAFVATWLPDHLRNGSRRICGPVQHTARLLAERGVDDGFDLVISTGLFDYLDDNAGRRLLADMCGLARPGGLVAVCNFAPEDASRIVKEWVVDWPLVYRDADAIRELAPAGQPVSLERSPDGGLVYALIATAPETPPSPATRESSR
jgi:hypothetical protein